MKDKCSYCGGELVYKEIQGRHYVICLRCREGFSIDLFSDELIEKLKSKL